MAIDIKDWKRVIHGPFPLYTKDATRSWKLVGSEGSNRLSIKEPSANILLLDYVSSEKWKDIIDFDDHLDDISKQF
ncbi:unnamed protein product [Ilex paraguariensis]|uniref:Uncharacterized protein n=1 Tax=Ilex paraguariensis TaxID=185542 RepID=A0ABC8RK38_9AQUA